MQSYLCFMFTTCYIYATLQKMLFAQVKQSWLCREIDKRRKIPPVQNQINFNTLISNIRFFLTKIIKIITLLIFFNENHSKKFFIFFSTQKFINLILLLLLFFFCVFNFYKEGRTDNRLESTRAILFLRFSFFLKFFIMIIQFFFLVFQQISFAITKNINNNNNNSNKNDEDTAVCKEQWKKIIMKQINVSSRLIKSEKYKTSALLV